MRNWGTLIDTRMSDRCCIRSEQYEQHGNGQEEQLYRQTEGVHTIDMEVDGKEPGKMPMTLRGLCVANWGMSKPSSVQ